MVIIGRSLAYSLCSVMMDRLLNAERNCLLDTCTHSDD
jgi:hypothetical protein